MKKCRLTLTTRGNKTVRTASPLPPVDSFKRQLPFAYVLTYHETMMNLTGDGNHKTAQQSFCRPDLYEAHQRVIISAINIVLAITAIFGNMLIIAALQKVSSLQPPSRLLLGCLASTDLCVGLIAQPLYVTHLMSPGFSKYAQFLNILIKDTINTMFCGVSLLTLTAISVDRLLALKLKLRYRQVVTLSRVKIFIIFSCLFSITTGITFFLNYRFAQGLGSVGLLMCMVISVICYTKIYFILRHHRNVAQDLVHHVQRNGRGTQMNIVVYKKTVSRALWIQMTVLACYLPTGISAAVPAINGLDTPSSCLTTSVTLTLLYFNSSLNPILYCWKMKELRQAVKDTIRQCWCFSC